MNRSSSSSAGLWLGLFVLVVLATALGWFLLSGPDEPSTSDTASSETAPGTDGTGAAGGTALSSTEKGAERIPGENPLTAGTGAGGDFGPRVVRFNENGGPESDALIAEMEGKPPSATDLPADFAVNPADAKAMLPKELAAPSESDLPPVRMLTEEERAATARELEAALNGTGTAP